MMGDLLVDAARCQAAAAVYQDAPQGVPGAPLLLYWLFGCMAAEAKEKAAELEARHTALTGVG